jgi:hypothetical protein
MNYRHLPLQCACGEVPEHISEVGFTDDHQLAIHWWCTRCKRLVHTCKSLVECWRACPGAENSLETRLDNLPGCEEEDSRFLRSIGVRPN